MRLEEAQHTHGTGELADGPASGALVKPGNVTTDLVRPGRRLKAECDRGTRLSVRAARHDGVPVRGGQPEHGPMGTDKVSPHQPPDVAHDHPEPGVREIL